ncbi:hypothetical protein KY289_002749 [Solanum tuberosum]|nr:hypothetical protein KY289_002749 [Solanum tuberosum]
MIEFEFQIIRKGTFMAYPSDHRSSSRGTVRFVLVLVGLFLVIYMVTTPTLRHSKALSSCPPCFCDCEEDPMFSPIDFLETLWRDVDMNRHHHNPNEELNLVIVSHGLASRVFLMKWFKWTVEQFEYLNNLGNCEFRVMELGGGGEYSLAVHHTDEEMLEWGMSPEMIADQKWRANANRGTLNDHCPWYLDAFFDHLADSNDKDDEDVK